MYQILMLVFFITQLVNQSGRIQTTQAVAKHAQSRNTSFRSRLQMDQLSENRAQVMMLFMPQIFFQLLTVLICFVYLCHDQPPHFAISIHLHNLLSMSSLFHLPYTLNCIALCGIITPQTINHVTYTRDTHRRAHTTITTKAFNHLTSYRFVLRAVQIKAFHENHAILTCWLRSRLILQNKTLLPIFDIFSHVWLEEFTSRTLHSCVDVFLFYEEHGQQPI